MSDQPRTRQEKKAEIDAQFQALPLATRAIFTFCLFFTLLTISNAGASWLLGGPLSWWAVIIPVILITPVSLWDADRRQKRRESQP